MPNNTESNSIDAVRKLIEVVYSSFILRDIFGFWVPGATLFFPALSKYYPNPHVASLQYLPKLAFILLGVGIPYGVGVILQLFFNALEHIYLGLFAGICLKKFYYRQNLFFNSAHNLEISFHERAVYLKLIGSKLSLAISVLFFITPEKMPRTWLSCAGILFLILGMASCITIRA